MNTFTYENTKDATHLVLINCEFKKIIKGNKPEYLSLSNVYTNGYLWAMSHFSSGYLLECQSLIELSRPHNETREYWTKDDVTQYAQPQGNTMDITKLIPIDFSLNITPFVVDDEIYNSFDDCVFKIKEDRNQLYNFNLKDDYDNSHLFVVSFADRPNTGKQPVGDRVVVNMTNDVDPFPAHFIFWDERTDETWKPNHAAMLKQWQAEQLEKGNKAVITDLHTPSNKERAHHVALQVEELGNQPKPLDIVIKPDVEAVDSGFNASAYEESCELHEINGKPVFTQAMCDANQMPPIGVECLIEYSEENWKAFTLIHEGKFNLYCEIDRQEQLLSKSAKLVFKPIKTDEEKLRDVIAGEISLRARDGLNQILDELLSSNKFEIKLKG